MKKFILVRYGELTLKGSNKKIFIDKLINNIKFKLHDYKEDVKYLKDNNSLILEVNQNIISEVQEILKTIFGIYSFSIIENVEKDLNKIIEAVIKIAKASPNKEFKLDVKRKDKSFYMTSAEIKKEVAPIVLRELGDLKVNVKNPNLKIEIVVKKDHVDIFDTRVATLKGLPVGVSGKALSLLSGGIDSPVSSFLTMKRGMQVNYIHFMTPPHTSKQALDKVFELAKINAKYNANKFSLFICDFALLLQELSHIKDQTYKITIMRRMFIRIANILAKKQKFNCLITGENLGQVASQTIDSINVINKVSDLPILRPILTYDKEEIIDIAKKNNTYETSILPFDDVCSMFVPKNPVTKPKIWVAENQENEILWEEIMNHTIENCIEEYVFLNNEFVKK